MPESKKQDFIEVGGRKYLWNRLPTTASVQLWNELSPVIVPTLMEVVINLPLVFIDGKPQMVNFATRELTGLPDALRKALKELPHERQMRIAGLALRDTMVGQSSVASDFDKHVDGTWEFYELLGKALWLQYGNFTSDPGGTGARLLGLWEKLGSKGSTTSAGPSSAS